MPTEKAQPLKPISSSDVAWTEWSDVPRFGVRYKHLTLAAGGEGYNVGVAIEELPPGKQSSPQHFHIFEEEHLFILDGSLTLRLGEKTWEMKAGDYVCFPAGQKVGHCLVNTSGATCRYVILGEHNPNEVVIYTDSRKVLVRALGRRALFDLDATRTYWDGEETGLGEGEQPPPDDAGMAEQPRDALPPISSHDLDWIAEGEGTRFGGLSKRLTHTVAGSNYRVGVRIESPAPGKRLAPTHYHMLEEEHALILEGQVTLILGEERYRMTAGDYVCFPAGRRVGHSFLNDSDSPCSYLMIGERNPSEVCVYPDSNKVAVDALLPVDSIFDMGTVKTYWDGEQTG